MFSNVILYPESHLRHVLQRGLEAESSFLDVFQRGEHPVAKLFVWIPGLALKELGIAMEKSFLRFDCERFGQQQSLRDRRSVHEESHAHRSHALANGPPVLFPGCANPREHTTPQAGEDFIRGQLLKVTWGYVDDMRLASIGVLIG